VTQETNSKVCPISGRLFQKSCLGTSAVSPNNERIRRGELRSPALERPETLPSGAQYPEAGGCKTDNPPEGSYRFLPTDKVFHGPVTVRRLTVEVERLTHPDAVFTRAETASVMRWICGG